MTEQPTTSPYLTTSEVAATLRVERNNLAWWRHARRGPEWFRAGRRVLYRRDVVDAWLAEQMNASGQGAA